MEVYNTGNLPALNFALALKIKAREDIPQGYTVFGTPTYEIDLAPKLDRPPIPIFSNDPLTQADWSAFNAGTKRIYAYGMLRYNFLPDRPPVIRPFCYYVAKDSPRSRVCPGFNTQYIEPTQQPH